MKPAIAYRHLLCGVLGTLGYAWGCSGGGGSDTGDTARAGSSQGGGAPTASGGSGSDEASTVPGLRPEPLSDASDALFDPTVLRRIDIDIPTDNGSPSSWESIAAEAPAPSGCVAVHRNYYEGSITFEGQTYEGVGVRTKGGCGSSQELEEKPSFKLHLAWDSDEEDEECPLERTIYGRKHLTLNNGVQDTTAMHEHLSFRYYRAVGVPAPRTAAIQVYVNGEYYGVYQLVETIDRQFLKRWFNTRLGKGMMYEGSYFCDILSGDGDNRPQDGSCWEREFELDGCDAQPDPEDDLQWYESDGETPQDPWKFLKELGGTLDDIQGAQSYYPAITATVAWEQFAAMWAASSIIVDWDGYAPWQNNYRIYHEPATDLWYFVPWGTDQTWVAVGGGGGWGDWGGDGPGTFGILAPKGDVARLCMEASGTDSRGMTCEQRYIEELYRQLEVFESIDWASDIDAWTARLSAAMQLDDGGRGQSYSAWQRSVTELHSFVESRAAEVRRELTAAGY